MQRPAARTRSSLVRSCRPAAGVSVRSPAASAHLILYLLDLLHDTLRMQQVQQVRSAAGAAAGGASASSRRCWCAAAAARSTPARTILAAVYEKRASGRWDWCLAAPPARVVASPRGAKSGEDAAAAAAGAVWARQLEGWRWSRDNAWAQWSAMWLRACSLPSEVPSSACLPAVVPCLS